jgi:hypothetical protein
MRPPSKVPRAAAVFALACACSSGGSSGSGHSGVPRDATLVSLTAQQFGKLCDWINASVGGYGSIDNCDGGSSRHADSNQQACIDGTVGCPAVTVGAVEDCINAIAGDLCRTETEATCIALEPPCP